MAKLALPCIACGRELNNVEDSATNQPYAGTTFNSYGHYGSTVYDPMDGRYLEINVCDLCLIQHQRRVLEGRDMRPVIEDGSQTGMEALEPPWRLTPWHVAAESFDWVMKKARKEFQLVPDDENDVTPPVSLSESPSPGSAPT